MSKTYRIPIVAMAQGLQSGYGYTSQYFSTGQEYYENVDRFCVGLQVGSMPELLKAMKPLNASLRIRMGVPSGTSKTSSYSGYYIQYEGETPPTDAEIAEIAIRETANEWYKVRYWYPATPIDISAGVFSCDGGTYKLSVDIPFDFVFSIERTGQTPVINYTVTLTRTGKGYDYFELPINAESVMERGHAMQASGSNIRVYAPADGDSYLELEYNEGTPTTYLDGPTGYIDNTRAQMFAWHSTYVGFPVETLTQTTGELQWKNGESGTVYTINVGSATRYNMAAGVLPDSGNILWRVVAQTTAGEAQSAWATVQTVDASPIAKPISPRGVYADGSAPIAFAWEHSIETGTAPTGALLRFYMAGDLIQEHQVNGNQTSAQLPANTLPSGAISWTVQTKNAEGVYGQESEPLSFVVVTAPSMPTIKTQGTAPRQTITWTAKDQQAFQIVAGDYDSETVFGTQKEFTLPVYLPDGQNRVQLRVLGAFNLWSDWAVATITVENMPNGSAPRMQVSGGTDADLLWDAVPGALEYWIYRDGKKIAAVSDAAYADRLCLGLHTWFVRAVDAGGLYYTDSNKTSAEVSVPGPRITALDGTWMDMDLSTTSLPVISSAIGRDISMMQYSGASLPVPELSEFKSRIYTINTAFADRAKAAQFEALIGVPVCVKDQYGNCIVGIMGRLTKMQNTFYTAFTCEVEEIDRSAYAEG